MADVVAKGTVWSWAATTIDQVTDFTGLGVSHDTVDVTDLADAWKNFLKAGAAEGNEVSLTLNWDPNLAIHGVLAAAAVSTTPQVLSVVYQSNPTTDYTCNAFVTGFEPSGSLYGKLAATVTFKPTGTVTL